MKITTKTKNLEASDSLNVFVEKKFLVLRKFFKKVDNAQDSEKTLAEILVEIEKETNHHRKGDVYRVKAQVAFPGKVIMSDETTDDLFGAVVQARDELKLEIEKFKAKKVDKGRREQRKAKRQVIQ